MRIASLMFALVVALAACGKPTAPEVPELPAVPAEYQAVVIPGPDGNPLEVPAVKAEHMTERTQRQRVAYNGPESAGTIVVDPYARFLYHVLGNGEAMRYGVAVGREGLMFRGTGTIQRKAHWPSWTPTQNMIRREPELYGPVAGGLKGGLDNPLGTRSLYLYRGGKDTMYRIHGTMEPESVGKATSAGCIRLYNQDILHLYDQVGLGTTVKVRSPEESRRYEGELVETPDGFMVPPEVMAQYQMDQMQL